MTSITDALPAGLDLGSVSSLSATLNGQPCPASACSLSGHTLTVSGVTVSPGQPQTVSYVASVGRQGTGATDIRAPSQRATKIHRRPTSRRYVDVERHQWRAAARR